jgi:hypothetical protein
MYELNATGWNYLMNADIIGAVFNVFNAATLQYMIAILFFTYQIMLWLKTRSITLCFITGLLFAVLYLGSTLIKSASTPIILVILVLEFAAILYSIFAKG